MAGPGDHEGAAVVQRGFAGREPGAGGADVGGGEAGVFSICWVKLGFKEIEIGFPSASQIEFDFTRRLIEEDRIPEGVWVQVLVQAKEELIARTFESLQGSAAGDCASL